MVMMNYNEAVDYIESLGVFGIKPGLSRIREMLAALGNPQSQFKSIHVAGTNGKGSVSAMLSKILTTAGFKTGLFTSPHLISYRERIKIDNYNIDKPNFAILVEQAANTIYNINVNGGECSTQFEALTAMALSHFAREGVDYAVIETGLGGLLDSTNVIEPVVSIITNVGMDHAERCGGTLEGIARHKAGIIKRGVPVVTAARGEPLNIIKATAARLSAPIYVVDAPTPTHPINGENSRLPPATALSKASETPSLTTKLSGAGGRDQIDFVDVAGGAIRLSLQGEYQRENAAVAIAAINTLNEPQITLAIIRDALEHVQWAGRFEIFTVNGKIVVIDGAHNPDGAGALRHSLDVRFPNQPRRFLFGVLRDKDFDTIINTLFNPSDEVIVTKPNSPRAAEPTLICQHLTQRAVRATPVENLRDAFKIWLNDGDRSQILIAAGSLYMIGAVRQLLTTQS